MSYGLGALIWIIKVLRCEESNEIKLELIHIRTIVFCYVFLLIVRIILAIIIIFHAWAFISILGCYLMINLWGISDFLKLTDDWYSNDRLTLYDIKKALMNP